MGDSLNHPVPEGKEMDFPCLQYIQNNKCPSKNKCSIYAAGFCPLFGRILKKEIQKFKKKGFSPYLEDILIHTYKEVIKSLPTLREKKEKVFVSFVRTIIHRCKYDILKKVKKQEIPFSSVHSFSQEETEEQYYEPSEDFWRLPEPNPEEALKEKEMVVKLLNFLRTTDHPCGDFLLFYLEGLKEGLSQKAMAQKLGIKENTFNQRKRRCFEWFRKNFSYESFIYSSNIH